MENLTANQAMYMIIMFFLGGSLVVNVGDYGSDIWIIYSLGSILGIVLFLIYYRIAKLHGFRTWPLIFNRCFGNWGGKLVTILYIAFYFFRMQNTGELLADLTSDLLMRRAPYRLIIGVMLAAALYGAHKGLTAIGRSSEIIFPIVLACLAPFLFTAFTKEVFTYRNLFPLLANGYSFVWEGVRTVTMYPFAEILLFCMLMANIKVDEKRKIFNRYLTGIIIGTVILIAIALTILAVVGKNSLTSLKYPFYNAMMLTGVGGLMERLDPLAILVIIMCGFYKGTLYLYFAMEFIISLHRSIKPRWVLLITGLLTFISAPRFELFHDKFLLTIIPLYIMPTFFLMIPGLIWGISEWRAYKDRKKICAQIEARQV